ncbi:hypothetical protein AURDEDRAFT_184691 [Auricularia subglabra TFB-10046 SS5]|nr:hypothetical protein AURDEDRAFT_184691 [Auricularia subglabra TFB-10046 SS5]
MLSWFRSPKKPASNAANEAAATQNDAARTASEPDVSLAPEADAAAASATEPTRHDLAIATLDAKLQQLDDSAYVSRRRPTLDTTSDGTEFHSMPEDSVLPTPRPSSTAIEQAFDPFSGNPAGVLAPLDQSNEHSHDLIWANLANIRELQSEIARMHVDMEKMGETKRHGDDDEGDAEDSFYAGLLSDAEKQKREAQKRAAEFEAMADQFKKRKYAIEDIMTKLHKLSDAVTAFNAMPPPTIRFSPRNAAGDSTEQSPQGPSPVPRPFGPSPVPLGSTCIPGLDAHLVSTTAPEAPLISSASLQHGDVLEITGAPKSGKTHLLYWLAMNCILPREILVSAPGGHSEHVSVGGWGRLAVVCDCDGRWDTRRLHSLLVSRIAQFERDHEISLPQSAEDIARACMKKLILYQLGDASSSLRLVAALHALPTYLRTTWPHDDLGLLAVDSMSATLWQDRMRYDGEAHAQPSVLRALASIHAPVTALTTWSLPNAPPPFDRSPTAPLRITHEITLAASEAAKVAPGVTPRQALCERTVARGLIFGQARTLRVHERVGRFQLEIHAGAIGIAHSAEP